MPQTPNTTIAVIGIDIGKRLCPVHPGNPRRNIEGESPHFVGGHTV